LFCPRHLAFRPFFLTLLFLFLLCGEKNKTTTPLQIHFDDRARLEKQAERALVLSGVSAESCSIGLKARCIKLTGGALASKDEELAISVDSKETQDEWCGVIEACSSQRAQKEKKKEKRGETAAQNEQTQQTPAVRDLPQRSTSGVDPASIAVFVGIANFDTLNCPRAVRMALLPDMTVKQVIEAVAKKGSIGIADASPWESYALFHTRADGGDCLGDLAMTISDARLVAGSRLLFMDTTGGKAVPDNEETLFPSAPPVSGNNAASPQLSRPEGSNSIGKGSIFNPNRKRRGSRLFSGGVNAGTGVFDDPTGPRSVADPLLEGSLMFRNGKKKKFAKKWLVLDAQHIHVFKSVKDKNPAKVVLDLQTLNPKEVSNEGKKICRLFTPAGEYDLHTESGSESEFTQWFKAIENAHFNIMNDIVESGVEKRDVLEGSSAAERAPSPSHEENVKAVSMFSAPVLRAPKISEAQEMDGNDTCADCGTPDTSWASMNLGVFLCIDCCGAHRSLGTHVTKMRSVEMDKWEDEAVEFMRSRGNTKVNKKYLAYVPSFVRKPDKETAMDERIQFARAKWEDKWFVARSTT
jgi:Putative GTPase activating protein for Arf/PH domain